MQKTERFKVNFTPAALDTIRTFTPDEYRTFSDLLATMQTSEEKRSRIEWIGHLFVMFCIWLPFMCLFVYAALTTPLPAVAPVAHPSLLLQKLFVDTAILMTIAALMVGSLLLAGYLATQIRRGTLRPLYGHVTGVLKDPMATRPRELIRDLKPDLYQTTRRWLRRLRLQPELP